MPVEYNTAAISGINLWLWKEIKTALGWSEINGRRPMAIQSEPEMVNSGKPFITFGWSKDMSGPMIELKNERAVYCIYSLDASEVVEAMNLMVDVLDRWDWSAQDLNRFLRIPGNGVTADQKKYDYKNIRVTSAMGPEPADQEGGHHEATITIAYSFTVPMASTVNQTFGFGRISQ